MRTINLTLCTRSLTVSIFLDPNDTLQDKKRTMLFGIDFIYV